MKEMEKISAYKKDDLKEVISEIREFINDVNPKFIETLTYKFKKPEYNEVANIQINFGPRDDNTK